MRTESPFRIVVIGSIGFESNQLEHLVDSHGAHKRNISLFDAKLVFLHEHDNGLT